MSAPATIGRGGGSARAFRSPPPERVIEPSEHAANIGAARSLRASSATDGQKAAVPLGAIDVSPIGRERRPPLDQSRPGLPSSTAPATIRRRAT
ncbi:MAG: hypothetical protein IPG28_10210 [Betaproteobacteria bacterium]|nr:hypothetical protein [Betaproteobacteria bacterium]